MIVHARLEAENITMPDVLADLDGAEDAIRAVLCEGTEISDEHYERMPAGEAHPPYFKGRRVFRIASISKPFVISMSGPGSMSNGGTNG